MENPFEIILDRLNRIEMILTEISKCATIQKPENTELMLSVPEAAKYFGVSKGSIYRWVMNGNIPKIKFGNKLYFRKDMLQQVLKSNTRKD